MAPSPDFQLFTSLRYDPKLLESIPNSVILHTRTPLYMLPYHRDRMLEAAEHFGWTIACELLRGPSGMRFLESIMEKQGISENIAQSPLRVKLIINHEGKVVVESGSTPERPLENLFPSKLPPPLKVDGLETEIFFQSGNPKRVDAWEVVVDSELTPPSSYTTYKTTQRSIYDEARERAGIFSFTEPKEVLIVNTGGEIMEGSLTSVIFWKGGRWVTPPVSSGGQAGTTRRWLIGQLMLEEETVKKENLVDGEECWLSNGVRGLIWAKVKL